MLCAKCGKNNSERAKVCFSCATALPAPSGDARARPAGVENRTRGGATPAGVTGERPGIVTLLAVLQFIGAFFTVLLAVASLAGGLFNSQGNGMIGIIVGVFLGVLGALEVVCGIGLWRLKSYGRTMQLVFAWMGLIGFPIGTVISIFMLVYLYKPGVKVLFSEKTAGELSATEAAQLAALGQGSALAMGLIFAVVALVLIAVVGIIAAIAIPGLLRARVAGNEASAIGTMRTITTAQVVYFERCDGYAPNLVVLGKSGDFLTSELSAAGTLTRSGYEVTIAPSATATPAPNAKDGCDQSVTDYFANAAPVTPGTTGIRHFATDASATIVYSVERIRNPIPAGSRPVM